MNVHSAARPPGPKGRSLFGNAEAFARDLLGFLTHSARDYGDVVDLGLGLRRAYLISHPDVIETVLLGRNAEFVKHRFFWRAVQGLFGNGLLTSEGEAWRRHHRLIAPAFTAEALGRYGEAMVEATQRMLTLWRVGECRDVHRDMSRLTLRIVAKVLFDVDLQAGVEKIAGAVNQAVAEAARHYRRPVAIPDWVPIPGNLRFRASVRQCDRLVREMVAERRAQPAGGGDLLSRLLAIRDDQDRPLGDDEVRDELITLLLAGHETTAVALSWTLGLLARHPDVSRRVAGEIQDVVGDRRVSADDAQRLVLTDAVIKEAMRLYPPAFVIGREATRECELGGYAIPAGTTLFMSQWVVHRDRRFFDAPEVFLPERWLDHPETRLPRFAYFPFGGGPRICMGARFATLEATLVLATLLQRVRFTVPPGPGLQAQPAVTLRPAGGVPLIVLPRAD